MLNLKINFSKKITAEEDVTLKFYIRLDLIVSLYLYSCFLGI